MQDTSNRQAINDKQDMIYFTFFGLCVDLQKNIHSTILFSLIECGLACNSKDNCNMLRYDDVNGECIIGEFLISDLKKLLKQILLFLFHLDFKFLL